MGEAVRRAGSALRESLIARSGCRRFKSSIQRIFPAKEGTKKRLAGIFYGVVFCCGLAE
jgi:hypothetical protein